MALIRREPDPVIAGIVAGWPTRFDAARARALGFEADASFDAIIAAHVADELGGGVGAHRENPARLGLCRRAIRG